MGIQARASARGKGEKETKSKSLIDNISPANKGGFVWSPNEEPHKFRREEILKKYPQIKELFGHDPRTKYIVGAGILLNYYMGYKMVSASWPVFVFFAYTVGGTINHMLMMAVHEASHNLLFKSIFANRLIGVWCNTAQGIPSAITFKRYHMEHHRYQGEDEIDVDIPTHLEAYIFTNWLTKTIFVFLQPLFYGIRPLLVYPKAATKWEAFNAVVVFSFAAACYTFVGPKMVLYFLLSTLFGAGFHPSAGHFIAEHYVYANDQETYSYYGPVNLVNLNVGYHNEHHDFPKISGLRLPQVRKIAAEFYDDLPYYTSYTAVLFRFIFDTKINSYSRVKRATLTSEDKATLKSL